MKSLFWLFLLPCALLAQPAPVAHYPMDGNALDISGNGNHGTVLGATLTADRFGNPNRAYQFDGVNDVINYTNQANFNPSLPVTLMAWVNISGNSLNMAFRNDWSENVYHGVWIQVVFGTVRTGFGDGGGVGPGSRRSKFGSTPINLNTWYHIAAVIRGQTDMTIYVNGKEDCGTYSGSGSALSYLTSGPGSSGVTDQSANPGSPLDYFNGKLDDIRFFDQALTKAEIRAIGGFAFDALELDTMICRGDSLVLQASAANQYLWAPAPGLSCTTCPNPVATPINTTTYQLIHNPFNACPDTLSYRVEVAPCCDTLLTLLATQTAAITCPGGSDASLQLQGVNGSPPYQFSLNNGPWQASPTFTGLSAGSYLATLLDANGCEADTSLTIGEPAGPTLSVIERVGPRCPGEANGRLTLLAQGNAPPYAYQLAGGEWQSTGTFTDLTAGTVQVTIRGADGCLSDTFLSLPAPDSIRLVIDSLREPNCNVPDGYLAIHAEGGQGAPYFYLWENGSLDSVRAGLDSGRYQLWVTDALGCADSLSINLTSVSPPIAEIGTYSPDVSQPIPRALARIAFRNASQGATHYQWTFDYQGQASTEIEPIFAYPQPGTYVVELLAQNATQTCQDRDTLLIIVVPDGRLFAPSAFSPNGDDHNDLFFFDGVGIVSLTAIIYNRWGLEVMRLNSLSATWNGHSASGNPLPEGVYVYRLVAQLNTGRTIEQAGSITLIR